MFLRHVICAITDHSTGKVERRKVASEVLLISFALTVHFQFSPERLPVYLPVMLGSGREHTEDDPA